MFKTVSEPFSILCFEREPTEFGNTRKQQDRAFMKTQFEQILSKQLACKQCPHFENNTSYKFQINSMPSETKLGP